MSRRNPDQHQRQDGINNVADEAETATASEAMNRREQTNGVIQPIQQQRYHPYAPQRNNHRSRGIWKREFMNGRQYLDNHMQQSNFHEMTYIRSGPSVLPRQHPANIRADGADNQLYKGRQLHESYLQHDQIRIREGASLYALHRSWFKNGHEESQPQNGDGAESLSRSLPLPIPIHIPERDTHLSTENDVEQYENIENQESIENLSAKELLQEHIKRGKRVRARIREERLPKIARAKDKLAARRHPPVDHKTSQMTPLLEIARTIGPFHRRRRAPL